MNTKYMAAKGHVCILAFYMYIHIYAFGSSHIIPKIYAATAAPTDTSDKQVGRQTSRQTNKSTDRQSDIHLAAQLR